MKIGIVNPYSWDVPGGVGFHIRDLALKLRSRGHDVRILTPSTSRDLPEWITSAGSSVSVPFNGSVANMSNSELFSKSKFLVNRPTDVLADNWQTTETKSIQTDYWVRNASFLKMDNVTLGYSFSNLLKQGTWNGISGRVYGTVNNVFCLTKYKGLDPEVFNGIDNNLYPRPISFILGLNLNF